MDTRPSRTLRRRRLVSCLAGAGLASGLVVPVMIAHPQVARATVTVAPDEVTASADAEAQGTPVEALSDRTNYTQVFANPDGTFSYNAASAAQRTQNADGTWSNLDPTLALQSDGTVRSAASQTGLVVSGGGSGPLVTMGQGSASLTIASPVGTLPAPTLSGATATYASVLSGVDLQVTASTEGVMETLVIYTAAAASNPALQSLSFGVGTTGLAVAADTDGGALVTDSSGNVVFDVPEPQGWDSTGSGSTATLPGASAAIAPLPLTVTALSTPLAGTIMGAAGTSESLSMSASSFLSDASRTYPKFIGKQVTLHGPSSWLDVGRNNGGGSWGDWEPKNSTVGGVTYGGLRIGASCKDYYGTCTDSTRYEYRTFMNFAVPHQIWGADKISATLYTNEDWSWTCAAKTTAELWQTDHASKGAVWGGPTERVWQDGQTVAYGNTCPAHGVSFNANSAAAAAASGKWSSLTLELRAYINDENNWNVDSWKRFSIITNASKSPNDTPYLQITWAHKPNAPFDVGTLDGSREVGCGSNVWVSTKTPTLEATIGDVDGLQLQAQFDWAKSTGSPSGSPPGTSYLKSPSQFTYTIPSSANIPDGTYTWDVNGNDQPAGYAPLTGPSASCSFGVDTTPPLTPTITSTNYTSGVGTNPIGTVGYFTFTDPNNKDFDGVNDVVGYRYGFSNQPLNYVAAGTDTSRTATVKISPAWLGSRTLYVLAVDRAGNLSPDTSTSPPAEFNVVTVRSTTNPTPLLAEWKLDEGSGTVAHDATGNGHDATLGAQAGWGPGRASGTSALSLTGGPDSEAFTAAQLPPVDNTGSFTVSAWVKLSPSCASSPSTCGFYDAVTIDGTTQSAFSLGYVDQTWCGPGDGDGVHGCWAFTMTASDVMNPPSPNRVEAATTVAFGTWVHLTGVYDQVHQTIAIYVNGSPASAYGPVGGVRPWAATAMGPLRMGRVLFNDGAWNWWPGELSDVCTFWGVLDSTQIGRVYSSGCSNAGAP